MPQYPSQKICQTVFNHHVQQKHSQQNVLFALQLFSKLNNGFGSFNLVLRKKVSIIIDILITHFILYFKFGKIDHLFDDCTK